MYSCLHLKFNIHTTKFNYLAPNQIPLSIPSFITSFSQGKISNSVTTNSVFLSPITYFFHCSHHASPTPISHCQFNLPEHPWIKAIHTHSKTLQPIELINLSPGIQGPSLCDNILFLQFYFKAKGLGIHVFNRFPLKLYYMPNSREMGY